MVYNVFGDEVVIDKFEGSLKAEDNEIEFDGYVSGLEVLGDTVFSVGG